MLFNGLRSNCTYFKKPIIIIIIIIIIIACFLAATRKHAKYSELERRYTVVPVAVETFGPINREGLAFLTDTGSRLCRTPGDARETSLLFQSLSVTIQRFNAVAFQGTMSKLSGSNERRCPSQDRFNDNVYDDS